MEISTSFDAGRLTVYISGELDHHEARCAMHKIDELLDEYLPRDCALNLSELRFMDSSGIALILKISRLMSETGGRAWVENARRQPLRVLDASGIDRLVKISPAKDAPKETDSAK